MIGVLEGSGSANALVKALAPGARLVSPEASGGDELQALVFLIEAPRAPTNLQDSEDADWHRDCVRPLQAARAVFASARSRLPKPQSHLLVLLPAAVMTGTPGKVAFATMAEGVRALAKSAASAWKVSGPRVTMLMIDGERMAKDAVFVTDELAPMVRDLAHGPQALNGATVLADGGEVLLP